MFLGKRLFRSQAEWITYIDENFEELICGGILNKSPQQMFSSVLNRA